MDALTLLKSDHDAVEELFKTFEAAGEKALKTKRKCVDRIIAELSRHASIEETLFYPACREKLASDDLVLEALEEHHVVKWLLEELRTLPADAERFDAKVSVLMESVRHHVKEEETELFPKVRKAIDPAARRRLGEAMKLTKKSAPTRPHPRSPDAPPANLAVTPVVSMLDKGRDLLQSLAAKNSRRRNTSPTRPLH